MAAIPGTITSPNGWDVAFFEDAAATMPLDFEREAYCDQFPITLISRVLGQEIIITSIGHPLLTSSQCSIIAPAVTGDFTVKKIDADRFSLNGTVGAGFTSALPGQGYATYEAIAGVNGWWTRIPLLPAAASKSIWVNYNKPGAADPSDPGGVWDPTAKCVYHFPRGYPFSPLADSTSNAYDLAQSSNVIQPDPRPNAVLGNGIMANTGGDTLHHSPFPFDPTDFTACFWLNTVFSFGSPNPIHFTNTTGNDMFIYQDTGGAPSPGWSNGLIGYAFTALVIPFSQWVFICVRIDGGGTRATCFLGTQGGSLSSQTLTIGLPSPTPTISTLTVYNDVGFSTAAYSMDEVEVYDGGLSSDRVETIFNNQDLSKGMYTVGVEQPGTGGYAFQREIVINHTLVPSDQVDFPFFVELTLPAIPAAPGGGYVSSGGGLVAKGNFVA